MAFQQWEIAQFQNAAEQVCYRMNEMPYEHVQGADGEPVPRWVIVAQRMAEFRVMVDAMRQTGMMF